MTKTTRKFISSLRKQFRESDWKSRKEIWDILTALRGPDSDSLEEKEATTCIIRSTVFGEKASRNIPALINDDNEDRKDRRESGFIHWHFTQHVKSAFKALNLKWDEIN